MICFAGYVRACALLIESMTHAARLKVGMIIETSPLTIFVGDVQNHLREFLSGIRWDHFADPRGGESPHRVQLVTTRPHLFKSSVKSVVDRRGEKAGHTIFN